MHCETFAEGRSPPVRSSTSWSACGGFQSHCIADPQGSLLLLKKATTFQLINGMSQRSASLSHKLGSEMKPDASYVQQLPQRSHYSNSSSLRLDRAASAAIVDV